jgi:hypothetical protein
VHCGDAKASSFISKVWGEVFAHFDVVAIKFTLVCGIHCLACRAEFFAKKSPWSQRKLWACSWLCSSHVSPFSVSVSLGFQRPAHASSPNACLIIASVSITFLSEICTRFVAHSLWGPSRNRIRPDTRLQMKGRKNQHVHSAVWNYVHWLPRYASIIYRCIALLQLLHRRQHQYRKLWIPGYNVPDMRTLTSVSVHCLLVCILDWTIQW